jgi:hypothetical protein
VAALLASPFAGSVSADAEREDGKVLGTEAAAAVDTKIIAQTFDWELDATAQHMKAQETFGLLLNKVAGEYAEIFAGASFAEEPGAVSQVMVKGEAPRGLRAAFAKSGLEVEIVEGMKYSEAELVERTDKLVSILGETHDQVSSAVLPSGEIQIAVAGALNPKADLPADLLDGVEIVEGPERISSDEADILGGVLVYATGGGTCTSGFSVRHNTTGQEGVATAAHCFGINRFSAPGADPVLSHRGEHNSTWGDVEWKSAAGHNIIDNYMARPGEERDVSMVWPAGSFANNMVTCVHSRVQGTRSCDRVYSTNVSVTVNGRTAGNLVAMDNDNTVGGDSGGPWSFGTIADGIHKGDAWISFGTRNVFTKAGNLPNALGVSVMTTP